MIFEAKLAQARKAVQQADAILIAAGAGMGVDSGLPDFRGKEGFWKAYPVIQKHGYSFSEMANPIWFERKPRLAWAFYGHRLNLYRQIEPHAGYTRLLRFLEASGKPYFIFTSNVDGHFQKAGFDESAVIECHGSIHFAQCSATCSDEISAARYEIDVDMDKFLALEPLPYCEYCGSILRPNILMFADWSWNARRTNAQEKCFQQWLASTGKMAIIECGAGKAVPTVRHTCELLSERFAAPLIRINPRDFDGPENVIGIPSGAKDAINYLCE